jgi:hypothetical protein
LKLIATDTGRILQLIVMEEIRPSSGLYLPYLFDKLVERYAFVARPLNIPDAVANGAKFNHGRLQTHNRTVIVSEIGVYHDGIIVDSLNTDDAEFIMQDLLEWARTTFAFRPILTVIPRRFTSSVTVQFDEPIEPKLRGLSAITKYMAAAFKESYGDDIDVSLLRIALNADPLTVPPLRNTQFLIERRIQRPYSENRYHCIAPLRTEDHIALLENIERALLDADSVRN